MQFLIEECVEKGFLFQFSSYIDRMFNLDFKSLMLSIIKDNLYEVSFDDVHLSRF